MARQKINVAALFADVSDSTSLYEALGETAAFGNVREVIGSLKSVTDACGGRAVKTIGNAGEIRLKREEMILYSTGKFAFGHSTDDSGAKVIEFSCG